MHAQFLISDQFSYPAFMLLISLLYYHPYLYPSMSIPLHLRWRCNPYSVYMHRIFPWQSINSSISILMLSLIYTLSIFEFVAGDSSIQSEWRIITPTNCNSGHGCSVHGQCMALFLHSAILLAQNATDPYQIDDAVPASCACSSGWSSALVLISPSSQSAAEYPCSVHQQSLLAVHCAWALLSICVFLYALRKLVESIGVIRAASMKKLLQAVEDRHAGAVGGDWLWLQANGVEREPSISRSRGSRSKRTGMGGGLFPILDRRSTPSVSAAPTPTVTNPPTTARSLIGGTGGLSSHRQRKRSQSQPFAPGQIASLFSNPSDAISTARGRVHQKPTFVLAAIQKESDAKRRNNSLMRNGVAVESNSPANSRAGSRAASRAVTPELVDKDDDPVVPYPSDNTLHQSSTPNANTIGFIQLPASLRHPSPQQSGSTVHSSSGSSDRPRHRPSGSADMTASGQQMFDAAMEEHLHVQMQQQQLASIGQNQRRVVSLTPSRSRSRSRGRGTASPGNSSLERHHQFLSTLNSSGDSGEYQQSPSPLPVASSATPLPPLLPLSEVGSSAATFASLSPLQQLPSETPFAARGLPPPPPVPPTIPAPLTDTVPNVTPSDDQTAAAIHVDERVSERTHPLRPQKPLELHASMLQPVYVNSSPASRGLFTIHSPVAGNTNAYNTPLVVPRQHSMHPSHPQQWLDSAPTDILSHQPQHQPNPPPPWTSDHSDSVATLPLAESSTAATYVIASLPPLPPSSSRSMPPSPALTAEATVGPTPMVPLNELVGSIKRTPRSRSRQLSMGQGSFTEAVGTTLAASTSASPLPPSRRRNSLSQKGVLPELHLSSRSPGVLSQSRSAAATVPVLVLPLSSPTSLSPSRQISLNSAPIGHRPVQPFGQFGNHGGGHTVVEAHEARVVHSVLGIPADVPDKPAYLLGITSHKKTNDKHSQQSNSTATGKKQRNQHQGGGGNNNNSAPATPLTTSVNAAALLSDRGPPGSSVNAAVVVMSPSVRTASRIADGAAELSAALTAAVILPFAPPTVVVPQISDDVQPRTPVRPFPSPVVTLRRQTTINALTPLQLPSNRPTDASSPTLQVVANVAAASLWSPKFWMECLKHISVQYSITAFICAGLQIAHVIILIADEVHRHQSGNESGGVPEALMEGQLTFRTVGRDLFLSASYALSSALFICASLLFFASHLKLAYSMTSLRQQTATNTLTQQLKTKHLNGIVNSNPRAVADSSMTPRLQPQVDTAAPPSRLSLLTSSFRVGGQVAATFNASSVAARSGPRNSLLFSSLSPVREARLLKTYMLAVALLCSTLITLLTALPVYVQPSQVKLYDALCLAALLGGIIALVHLGAFSFLFSLSLRSLLAAGTSALNAKQLAERQSVLYRLQLLLWSNRVTVLLALFITVILAGWTRDTNSDDSGGARVWGSPYALPILQMLLCCILLTRLWSLNWRNSPAVGTTVPIINSIAAGSEVIQLTERVPHAPVRTNTNRTVGFPSSMVSEKMDHLQGLHSFRFPLQLQSSNVWPNTNASPAPSPGISRGTSRVNTHAPINEPFTAPIVPNAMNGPTATGHASTRKGQGNRLTIHHSRSLSASLTNQPIDDDE
jgi:hypothetical protein